MIFTKFHNISFKFVLTSGKHPTETAAMASAMRKTWLCDLLPEDSTTSIILAKNISSCCDQELGIGMKITHAELKFHSQNRAGKKSGKSCKARFCFEMDLFDELFDFNDVLLDEPGAQSCEW